MQGQARIKGDPIPRILSAGIKTQCDKESTKQCIQDHYQPPGTPPHLKKYRKTFTEQPGSKHIHYGLVGAPMPEPAHTYGKKTHESEHVHQVIKPNLLTGLAEYAQESAEEKFYASRKQEPLGRPLNRGHELPQQTQNPGFKFGVNTIGSEPAKNLIFPKEGHYEEPQEVQKQYFKSHGTTGPGMQKNRDYNWNIDPNQHRFGLTDKTNEKGVQEVIQGDFHLNKFPKTKIVTKAQEDYRSVAFEELSKCKNQGQKGVTEEMVFGMTKKQEEWDASKCITGQLGSLKELDPDKDLGKTLRFGFRNQSKPGDEDRTFGIPSVRQDLLKPKQKSVANTYNYGDEPIAGELLTPAPYSEMGLEQEDWLTPRPMPELRDIFKAIGYELKIGKFTAIFNRAMQEEGRNDDMCSMKSFIDSLKFFEQQGLQHF